MYTTICTTAGSDGFENATVAAGDSCRRRVVGAWLPVAGLLALLLTAGCAGPNPRVVPLSPPGSREDPKHIYDEVCAATDRAEADVFVFFDQGMATLSENTTIEFPSRTTAWFDLELSGGQLKELVAVFDHPVRVRSGNGPTAEFNRLAADRFGRVSIPDLRLTDPLANVLVQPFISRIRELAASQILINTDGPRLLHGDLFRRTTNDAGGARGSVTMDALTKTGGGDAVVLHLDAVPAVPGTPDLGLAETDVVPASSIDQLIGKVQLRIRSALLAPGSVFQLDRYQQSRDYGDQSRIVVGADSVARLPFVEISALPGRQRLPGWSFAESVNSLRILQADLHLNTVESVLVAKGEALRLSSQSALLLRGITFAGDRAFNADAAQMGQWTWEFNTAGGIADVRLKEGALSLEGMALQLGQGSRLTVRELNFQAAHNRVLSVRGSGTLDLRLDGGLFALGDGYVAVAPGSRATFEGAIDAGGGELPGRLPGMRVTGAMRDLDLRVASAAAGMDMLLKKAGVDRAGINRLRLDSKDTNRGFVRIGEGSHIVARKVPFDSSKEWALDGTIDLVEARGIEGRMNMAGGDWIGISEPSVLTMRELRFDRERRAVSGRLTGRLTSDDGLLMFRRTGYGTQWESALRFGKGSQVLLGEPGLTFRSDAADGPGVTGTVDEVVLRASPTTAVSSDLFLGPAFELGGVGDWGAKKPTSFSFRAGAVFRIAGLNISPAGHLKGTLAVDAVATSGDVRFNERNAFRLAGPARLFTAPAGLSIDTTQPFPLSGEVRWDELPFDGGLLVPGGGTQLTSLKGIARNGVVVVPSSGAGASGSVGDLDAHFGGGSWSLGLSAVTLKGGSVHKLSATWSSGAGGWQCRAGIGDLDATLATAPADLGVHDGCRVAIDETFSTLRLTNTAVDGGAAGIRSVESEELAFGLTRDAVLNVQADTELCPYFKENFSFNHWGVLTMKCTIPSSWRLSGPFRYAGGRVEKFPGFHGSSFDVDFDSHNPHYGKVNKRIAIDGTERDVDSNVHGAGGPYRCIVYSVKRGDISDAFGNNPDVTVSLLNTRGSSNNVDRSNARPTIKVRLDATMQVEKDGVHLLVSDIDFDLATLPVDSDADGLALPGTIVKGRRDNEVWKNLADRKAGLLAKIRSLVSSVALVPAGR